MRNTDVAVLIILGPFFKMGELDLWKCIQEGSGLSFFFLAEREMRKRRCPHVCMGVGVDALPIIIENRCICVYTRSAGWGGVGNCST